MDRDIVSTAHSKFQVSLRLNLKRLSFFMNTSYIGCFGLRPIPSFYYGHLGYRKSQPHK